MYSSNDISTESFKNRFVATYKKIHEDASVAVALDALSVVQEKIPTYYHCIPDTIAIAIYMTKFHKPISDTYVLSTYDKHSLSYPDRGLSENFDKGKALQLIRKVFDKFKTAKDIDKIIVDVVRYYECLTTK